MVTDGRGPKELLTINCQIIMNLALLERNFGIP